MSERLNLATIQTPEDVDKTDWSKYATNKDFKSWVKSILYPVSQDILDRVCELAKKSNNIRLSNSMGSLYYRDERKIALQLNLDS